MANRVLDNDNDDVNGVYQGPIKTELNGGYDDQEEECELVERIIKLEPPDGYSSSNQDGGIYADKPNEDLGANVAEEQEEQEEGYRVVLTSELTDVNVNDQSDHSCNETETENNLNNTASDGDDNSENDITNDQNEDANDENEIANNKTGNDKMSDDGNEASDDENEKWKTCLATVEDVVLECENEDDSRPLAEYSVAVSVAEPKEKKRLNSAGKDSPAKRTRVHRITKKLKKRNEGTPTGVTAAGMDSPAKRTRVPRITKKLRIRNEDTPTGVTAPYILRKNDQWECKTCGQKYSKLNSVQRHVKRNHFGRETGESSPIESPSKYSDDPKKSEKIGAPVDLKPTESVSKLPETPKNKKSRKRGASVDVEDAITASKYRDYIIYDGDMLECRFCRREYTELDSLKRHIQSHLQSSDPSASITSRSSVKERGKISELVKTVGDGYACAQCDKRYDVVDSLRKHIKRAHMEHSKEHALDIYTKQDTEKGEYSCLICKSNFRSRFRLTNHLDSYHSKAEITEEEFASNVRNNEDGTLTCLICDSEFTCKDLLKLHVAWHVQPGYIRVKCDQCNLSIRKSWLASHIKQKHTRKDSRCCRICGEAVPKETYRNHVLSHGAKRKRQRCTKDQSCLCDICGMYFISRARLRRHILIHDRPADYYQTCEICRRNVVRKNMDKHLETHRRTQKGLNKRVCEECGKVVNSERGLQNHIKQKHSDNPDRYGCSLCAKTFTSGSGLRFHMKAHSGLKPHVCEICNRAFSKRSNLKVHKLIHSSERLFACRFCDRRFRQRHVMKKHEMRHTGETNHECEACGRGFIQKHHYESHQCGSTARNVDVTKPRKSTPSKARRTPPPLLYSEETDIVEKETYVPNAAPLIPDPRLYSGFSLYSNTYQPFHQYQHYQQPSAPVVHSTNSMNDHNDPFTALRIPDAYQNSHTTLNHTQMSVNEQDNSPRKVDKLVIKLPAMTKTPPRIANPGMKSASNCDASTKSITDVKAKTGDVNAKTRTSDVASGNQSVVRENDDVGTSVATATSSTKNDVSVHDADTDDDVDDNDVIDTYSGGANSDADSDATVINCDDAVVCGLCDERFQSVDQLRTHSLKHTDGNLGEPLECKECHKTFKNSSGLELHRQKMHDVPVPFTEKNCSVCNKFFPTRKRMMEHKLIHGSERKIECPVCKQRFHHKCNMRAHFRVHTGEKRFKCDVCGDRFMFSGGLKRHMQTHSSTRDYMCEVCGMTFTNNDILSRHRQTHALVKKHKCPTCENRTFTTTSQLQKHLASHSDERPFVCEICAASFKTANHLSRHRLTHTTERNFLCQYCTSTFKDQQALNVHIRRCHSLYPPGPKTKTKKEFPCSFCDKVYSDSSTLRVHENKHLGRYRYPCTMCDKGFGKKSELLRHVHVHRFGRGSYKKGMYNEKMFDMLEPGYRVDPDRGMLSKKEFGGPVEQEAVKSLSGVSH